MDLLVVAPAIGLSLAIALVAIIVAGRSAARAEIAAREASRISRASIERLRRVQSAAHSAQAGEQRALKQLRTASEERVMADKTRLYRAFLHQAAQENRHLMRPGHVPVIGSADEALNHLRVESMLWASHEVQRALRNFTILRSRRPQAVWPDSYTMAYARLESDLVAAMRRDLDPTSAPLSAEQIWGSISAGSMDPAFRLALISPLSDVLRNAGQDPAHFDLG
ncbi:hypothetical protein J5X07_01615 [Actinomyces bowdenii]|uniref:Uncharacterized protein n=1 Tax=Actinomyces bowdenii TaxID=131109 RepID=A0A3P1V9A4_9ACTO|nr:hypothetical protein [Actinomyces bowdenii]MBO3723741.1 hypothetical protein [Actinomyces bowdenii]RRD30794.1 hypothetical protein EII10_01425 [Actinomyces bowdenii]